MNLSLGPAEAQRGVRRAEMAGSGMEQSQKQWTSPPALAQGPNQKEDYCFTAVLVN